MNDEVISVMFEFAAFTPVYNFTDVIVNTISPDGLPSTIHHELRHVLLGDFGRVAPYGAHGTGQVNQQTTEAEKEAVKNSRVK